MARSIATQGPYRPPTIYDLSHMASFANLHPLGPVQGIIMHHTGPGMRTAADVVSVFRQRDFPSQFVIDKSGKIYQTLPTGMTGRQIEGTGKKWESGAEKYPSVDYMGLSNANTIGVEIMGANDKDINPDQVAAAKSLYQYLSQDPSAASWNANGLPSSAVYGHGRVNPGRKEATEGITAAKAIQAAFPAPAWAPAGPPVGDSPDMVAGKNPYGGPPGPWYDPKNHAAFQGLADQTADKYGIPHDVFNAMIYHESNWDPGLVSPKGAVGIAQVKPSTAGLTAAQLKDPATGLDAGARYLVQQYEHFGSWPTALAAYNAGPGNVQAGQGYAREVMALQAQGSGAYGGAGQAASEMAAGQVPASPTTVADITAPPTALPPSSVGADRVVQASIAGDPAHLTSAWNNLVGNIMSGGPAAMNAAKQYFGGMSQPAKTASAASMAFNPDLWKSVPSLARAPMQSAADDILTGGHAVEQMKSLGLGPAAGPARFPSSDDMAALGLTPQERNLYQHHLDNISNGKTVTNPDGSTSTLFQMGVTRDGRDYNIPTVWDGKILSPPAAMQKALGEGRGWNYWPSYPASSTTNPRMGSFSEADYRYGQMHDAMEKDVAPQGDPLEITKDPLQKINYQGGPMAGASMATTAPPVTPPGLDESMSYAMGSTPDVTFPLHLDAPAAVQPIAYAPPPPMAPPPKQAAPSIATAPPKYVSGEGRLGKLYNAIAAPIRPGSPSFWNGPMVQPFFTQGGGGAKMPYQSNTGLSTTDVHGNKVNLGVYTDNNGNQHTYELG